jgi:hypothetical protein
MKAHTPRKRFGQNFLAAPGIVAWTQTRQTNGFLDASNGLFQAAKRKARGYGSLSTIRVVVFLLPGKLDFSKINPYAA